MFKARIKADSLKEFIGTVGSLVDEAKINVSEDGLQVKAVDPSHVAMIEANLMKSAFDSFEVSDIQMGLDIDKFKSVLTMAGKDEMVILEKDDELNRLVVNIGNLTRAMPLLDTSGMPDPKVPSLDLPAAVSVASGEIGQGIKASKAVSDHIALSTSKDTLVRADGLAKIIANDLLLKTLLSSRLRNFDFTILAKSKISHNSSLL